MGKKMGKERKYLFECLFTKLYQPIKPKTIMISITLEQFQWKIGKNARKSRNNSIMAQQCYDYKLYNAMYIRTSVHIVDIISYK